MSYPERRLYLVRHAHAGYTLPDAERALTEVGIKATEQLGRVLPRKQFPADTTMVSSHLRRAIETAEILHREWLWPEPIERWQGLAPESDPEHTATQLNASTGNHLLVGHNPHLSYLASILLTGKSSGCSVHFRKAAAMALRRSGRERLWTLEWFGNGINTSSFP
jgi:phosphohistidine phosphatase